jgi:hypothetical protein
MLRIATAFAVLALTAPVTLSSGASASNRAGASPPRVGGAGVTVALPHGWHSWTPTGPPGPVVDPLTRIVAISAPFRFAASGCQIAGYSFPSNAVALVVVEWRGRANPGAHFAPRPRHFTARSLPLRAPPAIECFNGPGGSVQFVDHGRTFGAYILLGSHAPASLADRARAVLQTLRVQPARPLTLAGGPYLGVRCPHSNSINCDTVGLAVELTKPADGLDATIAGQAVTMVTRTGSGHGPRGTYFEGFLHPAGLTSKGPLHVQPDGPGGHWVGRHAPKVIVRMTAYYHDGASASRTVTATLRPGWG